MPKEPAESLQSFLQRQDAATLAALLLELASDHDVVQARLARMQLADRPDKLAAAFKKTLAAWRRSAKFYGYRESREFGLTLETWLDQVARELLPRDPPAAVALFESFIEADASWFERADDSDGCIGDAVRAACRHWLTAASQCETPADVWPERLMKLFQKTRMARVKRSCGVSTCFSQSPPFASWCPVRIAHGPRADERIASKRVAA